MKIKHFFDRETNTLTYVLHDESSRDAVIIDPVLNFDPTSGTITEAGVLDVTSYVNSENLKVRGILETHAHADHLSGAQALKKFYPTAVLAMGEKIKIVQEVFKKQLDLDYQKTDGSQFDKLFKDFEDVNFGTLKLKAIPTPGHTPACMSYLFEDILFTGDALFMPDYGTGRCDFPEGSAKKLYGSITKNLYTLPDSTRVFVGHDYLPNGRELQFETTIGESKKFNTHLNAEKSEKEFVTFRESRDKTLKPPRLLYPSIQVNINAGKLPPRFAAPPSK